METTTTTTEAAPVEEKKALGAPPAAPPGEKAPVAAPADLKTAEGQVETPPGEAQGDEKNEKTADDPSRVLFDLVLEDGTVREVSAREAAEAISLADRALKVLDENKKLANHWKSHLEGMRKSPLRAVLDWTTRVHFGGDRDAAYEHLMKHVGAAHAEYQELQALPPEELRARRAERAAKLAAEKLRAREEQEKSESAAAAKAERLSKLKKNLDKAITENQLPNTEEARYRLIQALKRQRAAGRKPDIAVAVKDVQGYFDRQADGLLKVVPIERLKKTRPEIVAALEAEKLAEVKKGRQEQLIQQPPTPPDKEPVSHRIPISRW